mgnify:CR=1 FL=1
MIDIQNHIRNEGLLNLFDGKGYTPVRREGTEFIDEWHPVSAEALLKLRKALLESVPIDAGED